MNKLNNVNMKKTISRTASYDEKELKQEPANLLCGMRIVLQHAQASQLSDEFFKTVEVPMAYLCGRLNLTPTQVTFLATVLEEAGQVMSLSNISSFLRVSNIDLLSKGEELNDLVNRRFMKLIKNRFQEGYTVPRAVVEAFKRNVAYQHQLPSFKTDDELAIQLDKMLSDLDNQVPAEKETDIFDRDLKELLGANEHLHLAKTLLNASKKLTAKEFRVLVLMSMYWIRDEEEEVEAHSFGTIFNNYMEKNQVVNELLSGKSIMVKKKMVEVAKSGPVLSRGVFSLTPEFRKALTPERKETDEGDEAVSDRLTPHTGIVAKNLFYNAEAEGEVARLRNLLHPDNLHGVHERMKERGMRGGFTILLYGGPGTGKTETVLQLARECGRDIFQVEVSQLRSKWYGESEKLVKGVFDEYRSIVAKSKITPIMFFNEADAIFNRRMENAQRSVDKGENALQNIILQEMETLNGILIATTNLQKNLDPAFERRFLFKLHLGKPTADVKARIWQSMLPDLSENEAQTLADQFDFSGGQIENIVRKRFIDEVLTGKPVGIDQLLELCRNESYSNTNGGGNTIGFRLRNAS